MPSERSRPVRNGREPVLPVRLANRLNHKIKESGMLKWYRRLGLAACGILLVMLLVGCHKREHRKMTMHEEQREGEVQEEHPGEMVVE